MKKVVNYLPLHFVVCVILGIVLQFYTQFWEFGFLKLLFIFVTLLLVLILINSKIAITFLSFFLFFMMGIASVFINDTTHYKNYYARYVKDTSNVILKVKKVLKSSMYHHKYEVEVVQIDSVKTRGNVLLNLEKDSLSTLLKVDELLYIKPNFEAISKPLNPHQFDYKYYLAKQGVYQQVSVNKNQFKSLGIQQFSLGGISAEFRNRVQQSLQKHHFKDDELAVINALLLGQRQEISKELLTNYSKAGAIHILAVSGLHVGILLWILTWLLVPLERLKKGKMIKIVCIVLLLWMFAFIAGLTASVVRAVTMFTFLAVGLSFHRKNVILFSLISSMFFLLIFKPMFLFDVGFQLSYLAVFGIVFVQPKLFKLYEPKFWLDKKTWEITSVSVAAQVGVLPLSLYYFHQFPGLFMLSNLVIIPFLGAILVGGIIIIILALIGFLPQFLASTYGYIIAAMNTFVSWISNQEQFLLQEIPLSLLMLLAAYLVIVYCFRFLTSRSPVRLFYVLIGIVLVQSVYMFENHQKDTKKEFIVFHKSRNTIIGKRVGEQFIVHHDLDSLGILKSNAVISYKIGENVKRVIKNDVKNVYQIKNQIIVVVDSLGVYQIKHLKNPIVLLQQSPKINLERLIKTLSPQQIIADGSNYKSYVKRWEKTAKKQKTPFHYTGENGAFIY
jgi:competence protein ComEC